MGKAEREKYVEERLGKSRYVIKTTDFETLEAIAKNDWIKANTIMINYMKNKNYMEVYVNQKIIEEMKEKIILEMGISEDKVTVIEKGEGLSNLFPL